MNSDYYYDFYQNFDFCDYYDHDYDYYDYDYDYDCCYDVYHYYDKI